MFELKDWITVSEASEMLGIKSSTIYSYISRNQVIPKESVLKVGSGVLVAKAWAIHQKNKKEAKSTQG